MATAADAFVNQVIETGFHEPRSNRHSRAVSDRVWKDLLSRCDTIAADASDGVICLWQDVNLWRSAGSIDMVVGEPDNNGLPDPRLVRIVVEHKSMMVDIAKNLSNRINRDIGGIVGAVHASRPAAVVGVTCILNAAPRVLCPWKLKSRVDKTEFETEIIPLLKEGNHKLEQRFPRDMWDARPDEPSRAKSEWLERLPRRARGTTHLAQVDALYVPFVHVDHLTNPRVLLPRVDEVEYGLFIDGLCSAYTSRSPW